MISSYIFPQSPKMYDESISNVFFKYVFVGWKHLFMMDHLFYFKVLDIKNTVQEE